jgi:hypothetical protein
MALFPYNRLLLAVAASALVAATPPATSSNERAYTLTLMCTAIASEYGNDADKHRAMDAATKMARAQGYSDKRLANDMISMASVVGDQIHNQSSQVSQNREICRRIGLVG